MITRVTSIHDKRCTKESVVIEMPRNTQTRNIVAYTWNSHYFIQFDAIQVLKFCEGPSKVCLRHEMQLMCHCTSFGSCTDTRYHRFSKCNENREELHVKSHDSSEYPRYLVSLNSCVRKISLATNTCSQTIVHETYSVCHYEMSVVWPADNFRHWIVT